jgi:anaphase-promoting complex subunit 1
MQSSLPCSLQLVLEGQGLNLGITAPGATLALALMYLKTGDTSVASSFVIPGTQASLQVWNALCVDMLVCKHVSV